MAKGNGNPCIRCGKQRVIVDTWKEHVGKSLLTHTSFSCPDRDCQKIVDGELAAIKEKRELHAQRRLQVQHRRSK